MKRLITLLICLFVVSPAWAVPTFDAATTNETLGTGSTVTIAHTTTGSNRFLTTCIGLAGTTVSSVTYNSVGMTAIDTAIVIDGVEFSYWGLIAPASGANNLVITPAVSGGDIRTTIVSYTAVHQTVPMGTAVHNSGVVQNTISVDATSAAGELVGDCLGIFTTGVDIVSVTVGAGQTQRAKIEAAGTFEWEAQSEEAGAATTTMSWDFGTSNFIDAAIFAVPLKPVAAAAVAVHHKSSQ